MDDRDYKNGRRDATLAMVQETLDEIKASLAALGNKLDGHILRDAGLRTQVKVLWAAAAVYGVTILGLALKVVLG